jgi:hypothetical protein
LLIHGAPKSQDAFEVALRLSLDEAQWTRTEIKLLASQSISFVAGSALDEHHL